MELPFVDDRVLAKALSDGTAPFDKHKVVVRADLAHFGVQPAQVKFELRCPVWAWASGFAVAGEEYENSDDLVWGYSPEQDDDGEQVCGGPLACCVGPLDRSPSPP